MTRHVDVLILGAGISGVGMACRLGSSAPDRTYAIIERRSRVGGTWDLFRYPGIRSDSDMYSFSFGFKPWHGAKVLADGASIREYIQEAAHEHGVLDHIHFGRTATTASWSSADAQWTVEALDEITGETETFTSNFLVGATGYYDYDQGYRPEFTGEADFAGQIVHPQQWPADLDYRDKRVVVIGSGATAITLIPAMSHDAAHVTMVQRSPTYILGLPGTDPVASALSRTPLPKELVYKIGRARNIAMQRAFYLLSRAQPALARRLLLGGVRARVGPDIDMRHFTPSYKPWDQRVCIVPNGDLFRALRSGRASIATDTIERFTETGLTLASGEQIPADIIITATGLNVQSLGGADLLVDGRPVAIHDHVLYKSVLPDGVPNAMIVLGYTNASWTLKSDLAAEYFCRVLAHMKANGFTQVVAHAEAADKSAHSLMGGALTSGYIQRGDALMPRQGTRSPWQALNNYYADRRLLRKSPIVDGPLSFSRPAQLPRTEPPSWTASGQVGPAAPPRQVG